MGIGTKCVGALVAFANSKLSLQKFSAGYYENNLGSAKIFKKNGFLIEGRKRDEVIFEGKRVDIVLVGHFVG